MLSQFRHITAPSDIEEIKMRQPGETFGISVGVGAAEMNAEGPAGLAPLSIIFEKESFIVVGGNHSMGAFAVEKYRRLEVADVSIDAD